MMTMQLLIEGLLSIMTAFVGVVLALRFQHRWLSTDRVERDAWEHAQNRHRHSWEKQQKKRTSEIESKLMKQIEHVQEKRAAWEAMDNDRSQQLRLEYELRHLPTTGDIPLSLRVSDYV
jgi:myosin heavy subunit